nr:unnamed protein product [Callosobruchus analis]
MIKDALRSFDSLIDKSHQRKRIFNHKPDESFTIKYKFISWGIFIPYKGSVGGEGSKLEGQEEDYHEEKLDQEADAEQNLDQKPEADSKPTLFPEPGPQSDPESKSEISTKSDHKEPKQIIMDYPDTPGGSRNLPPLQHFRLLQNLQPAKEIRLSFLVLPIWHSEVPTGAPVLQNYI